ncbi:MAG: YggS family pyridoxal phosphate-dependent enzyme [Marinirhabdus sp.]|nr:YggS family pyridoxal phosphate-dependent enzyme [Marinirhabdus sp.]
MQISENITHFRTTIPEEVRLVAVSKTKPESDILEAYEAGQRIFGENKVQEMEAKWEKLPKDIEWHMIGHVQRNKVKYMAPFVSLIHAVDSPRLLKEINKQAKKCDRTIRCLLQIKIADEDSKFGMSETDAKNLLNSEATKGYEHVKIIGLMGMATFTDDENQVRNEFKRLKRIYDDFSQTQSQFEILSMGMSGDYKIAIEEGSNMIRMGSSIFGERNYNH